VGIVDSKRLLDRHLVRITVTGRSATFGTASAGLWKAARTSGDGVGVEPQEARFALRIDFRPAAEDNANEVWDLVGAENLCH
jgi:hypothetical protein